MTKKEINSKLDEIISFAGVERYIDTPVKRYSSGMTVRLAFSVAAHLEPDILVIDEVLAVGDAEFQKKAIGKMQDISRGEGRTVLFVSHNMAAVKSLCTRGIVLENGEVVFEGGTNESVEYYLQHNLINKLYFNNDNLGIYKNEKMNFLSAKLNSDNNFSISEEVEVHFNFELYQKFDRFNLSLVLYSIQNETVFNSISPVCLLNKGIHTAKMIIPKNLLNTGIYKIRILFVENSKSMLDFNDILIWEAIESKKRDIDWYGNMIGVVRPKLKWELT